MVYHLHFLFGVYNYINDVLNEDPLTCVGCSFGMDRSNVLAYTNDIPLIATSEKDISIIHAKFCNLANEHNYK